MFVYGTACHKQNLDIMDGWIIFVGIDERKENNNKKSEDFFFLKMAPARFAHVNTLSASNIPSSQCSDL